MQQMSSFVWFDHRQVAVNLNFVESFDLLDDENGPILVFRMSGSNEPIVITDSDDIDNFMRNILGKLVLF